jgi:hypothetical protein
LENRKERRKGGRIEGKKKGIKERKRKEGIKKV